MQIKIQRLRLNHFKGIRNFEASFDNLTTNVFGENGSGKTTLFDAFTWLLFGKDSKDRKDFEVKTLDENNQVIPKIDHEVEADILVDEQLINLKKVLRENWVKKRGSEITELAGNETLCYWNDVPMKVGEFQDKVSSIVNENIFKLITNPLYFNTVLKWQDRRTILFTMADKVYDADVLEQITTDNNRQQIANLTNLLNQQKTITDIKKEYAVKRKKVKDELDLIPTRIDEANKSLPELVDYAAIEEKITALKAEMDTLEQQKSDVLAADRVQNDAILVKQQELNGKKLRLQQLKNDLVMEHDRSIGQKQTEINNSSSQLSQLKSKIDTNHRSITSNGQQVEIVKQQLAELRQQWADINAEQLFVPSEDNKCCPTCKQPFPADKLEADKAMLEQAFNRDKGRRLDMNKTQGLNATSQITTLENGIKAMEVDLNQWTAQVEDLNSLLQTLQAQLAEMQATRPTTSPEIQVLENEIAAFVIPQSNPSDFTEINNQITKLHSDILDLSKELFSKEQRANGLKRIDELKSKERDLSQQLADLEATEFVLEQFNKTKVEAMQESVNRRFSTIKFKVFETQLNGGEVECCEALVNTNGSWVPYSNANTAGQINAGVDVINTLCEHHKVLAPIFIDNRESVNNLMPTNSQVINLIVSQDKQLNIQ